MRNNRGFSIVEVILALLLLVTVAGGIFSAFLSANKWIEPEVSTGYNVARQRIEDLGTNVNAVDWNQTGSVLYPTSTSGSTVGETNVTLNGKEYAPTRIITPVRRVTGSTEDSYRKTEVVVSFPDPT